MRKYFFSALVLGLFLLMFFINMPLNGKRENELSNDSASETPSPMESDEETYGEGRKACEMKIHRSPIPQNLKARQYARKKLIRDICSNNNTFGLSGKWQTFDRIPTKELDYLLVDDRHGIIYCYVPKVGCTAWKRIMIVLSESLKVHGVPYKDPLNIPVEQVHTNSIQHLNQYPMEVMRHKLSKYKKFMFVRDPFVRLISGYKDKLEKPNQVYYELLGIDLMQKFQNLHNLPKSAKEAHDAGYIPSFSTFIQYLLSTPADKAVDEHWRQVNKLCHPCQIEYDFIGKFESLNEDAAHLLRILQVDNLVHLEKRSEMTEENSIESWYANIPPEWKKQLLKMYEADFKLFGYNYTVYQ